MKSLPSVLHAAFHEEGTRPYRVVGGVVWALIVASIVLLVLEALDVGGPAFAAALRTLDRALLALFALELVLRVASVQPPDLKVFARAPIRRLRAHVAARVRFLLHPMVLIDLVTVLALVPALRGLRVLRLLRLLRSLDIFRYGNPFVGVMHALAENRMLFSLLVSFLGVETLLGGLSIYLVERGDPASGVTTVGDGIWWALVTLTTVGFGDITPVTALGRVVGGVLMIGGMFTLAGFAGVVGHSLHNTVLSVRQEQFRMGNYVNHLVICGHYEGSGPLLEILRAEPEHALSAVVFFENRDRPRDLPPDFEWVHGDPTKESELEKVRMAHARAVIISGSRVVPAQQADAITILTAFTIRRWLKAHPMVEQRRAPLYIVAEVLDSENVDHARAAGADEVIETRRLGYSMLAHTIAHPGTADFLSRLVLQGGLNTYVGKAPVATGTTFAQLAHAVKSEHGALAIGIRSTAGGDRLNPPDDTPVSAKDSLIYLAERPCLES